MTFDAIQLRAQIERQAVEEEAAGGKAHCAFDIGQFLRAIKSRRSIHDYEASPVEREKLECTIQAGRYPASDGNRQACRLVTVQDDLSELKK